MAGSVLTPHRSTRIMAIRWYTLAPDMVVYFLTIVVVTKALERVLTSHCAVYRDHLTSHQRRKFIAHGWLALTAVAGFLIQCTAYMPELFTGAPISPAHAQLTMALSTLIVTVYMHDLAYTRANAALMLHHLATALALVMVVFAIDDVPNSMQTLLMFSTILLLFETLSGTTYVAMILHRLWASPVPHPVRYVWAGRFMAAAAWWFVITRAFVYVFAMVRYVQAAKLGECGRTWVCGRWYWAWMFFLPVLLLALLYAHSHTAVVMFKLARRYVDAKPRELQDIVVGKDEGDLLAT